MTERTIICAWCLKAFRWTLRNPKDPAPIYCGKTHKNAANRSAQRIKTHHRTGFCPTPQKRSFDTSQQADRWRKEFPEVSALNRPYLCSCGTYHLGRVPRHVQAKATKP